MSLTETYQVKIRDAATQPRSHSTA